METKTIKLNVNKQFALEESRWNILAIKKDSNCTNVKAITREKINAIVYTYSKDGRPLAIYYNGNSKKSKQHYYYKTEGQRTERIEDYFNNLLSWVKHKEAQKIKQVEQKNQLSNKIQVGTLLHGSWGYDQTNCELYQVVEKNSRCKVTIREIKAEVVKGSDSFMSCSLKPVKDVFVGPEKKCTISAYGVILHRSCTLHPTTENETFYSSWYA